jgi:predicted glycosyltransferase involved in capsule biosynthesis
MKKLCIVVPYRDRESHLKIFAPRLKEFLKNEGTQNDILIVEQEDGKPFNRAKLLNVGFAYTEASYDYYCFHDVDMIPVESDYSYCNEPTHLASRAQQFGYRLPYQGYFGGVTIFDRENFARVNGYSNEYWGWGAEDDDMFNRCGMMKVITKRKDGMYESLSHDRNIPQDLYQQNVSRLRNMNNFFDGEKITEGLSTLEYKVVQNIDSENYKKITVSI